MAQFDLDRFYRELNDCYDSHDNAATEAFLALSRKQAAAAGDPLPFNDSCPSCAPEVRPNMDLVAVCNEQACFYRGLSRFAECMEAFSAAQDEMERLFLTGTAEYGVLLLNKAGAYRYMGELEQAMAHFTRARMILEAMDTPPDVLAGLYNNIGLVELDRKHAREAAEHFESALEQLSRTVDRQTELATTYNNIAAALSAQGKYTEAVDAVNAAIGLLAKMDNGLNSHYPAALNTRGILRFRSGKPGEALADFILAAEKTEIIYGHNVEYATACANCADICAALGRDEEAAQWRQRSAACAGEKRT